MNTRRTTGNEDTQKLSAQGPAEPHRTSQIVLLSAVTQLKASPTPIENSCCGALLLLGLPLHKAREWGMPREDSRQALQTHTTSYGNALQLNFRTFREDPGQATLCAWPLLRFFYCQPLSIAVANKIFSIQFPALVQSHSFFT